MKHLLVIGLLSFSVIARADVHTICDLIKDPKRFDKQTVTVRGPVSTSFEWYGFDSHECSGLKDYKSVWIMYGGDVPGPTPSTANDNFRTPGSAPKVSGKRIEMVKDAQLDLFRRRLGARRLWPTEVPCPGECYLYNVSATFRGVFLAGNPKGWGGYGHLGCCHLLMVEQIQDVVAERTDVVAGGRFKCDKDSWLIPKEHTSSFKRCPGDADCAAALAEQRNILAQHWKDHDHQEPIRHLRDWHSVSSWLSDDGLTSYHVQDEGDGLKATRVSCEPTTPPIPMNVPVFCSDLGFHKKDAPSWDASTPHEIADAALATLLTEWKLKPSASLRFVECDKRATVSKWHFSYCRWQDAEDLQRISITLSRNVRWGKPKGPWRLTGSEATICAAESPQAP